ncbi:circularly permuted type 2 ATP-grasp protein [Cellulomonas composti]|uniref:circularly permuted type 2 ATP-grasp protein n=1 Tax=Cellulomonas composti TaxID=266130 RepID=UPI0011BD5C18|nr:circularly permuted type 2 ATP-grasp protein [Cellulomonas composti]
MTDLLSVRAASAGTPDTGSALGLLPVTPDELAHASDEGARLLAEHGVTYGTGVSGPRPWRLDPDPMVLDEAEWTGLAAGLEQRASLLDEVLRDLYGPRRLLSEGLLPPAAILSDPALLRAAHGLRLPGSRDLVLAATDLVRGPDGAWAVVDDRTQAPSGAGYAMEGRRIVAQVLASAYRQAPIQRLGPFFRALRHALHASAPPSDDEPAVVLLSPGPGSETAFDQAYLASMLGLPLVEGSDLVVREGRLWLRALDGLEPVDVVLRRVDDAWCDPLELLAGSRLGVPGLVHAVRQGSATIVNPLGAGILENPALLAALPRIARAVLGEDLGLPAAPTWWCGDDDQRRAVLDRLDRLVVLPVARSSGSAGASAAVAGWTLSDEARGELAARIEAEPWRWAAQEPWGRDLDAAHARPATTLRTFAVPEADGGYLVMAGGLARLSGRPDDDSAWRNDARDVWVLQGELDAAEAVDEPVPSRSPVRSMPPRVAENMFWLGRYAERAGQVVRALRVVADRYDDYHARPHSPGGRALAVALEGLLRDPAAPPTAPGESSGPRPSLRDLALDANVEGSVAQSVQALAASAAAVRDQLSTDTFGPISRMERALREERRVVRRTGVDAPDAPPAALTQGLRGLLDRLLESLYAIAGIAAEGLVRDDGWNLLDAGRRLERAQHLTSSLLGTLADVQPPGVETHVLESVLLAHESAITARRRYQGGPGVVGVVELLVLDPDNPRSLVAAIGQLRADLAGVARPPGVGTDQRDRLLADVADLLAELDPAAAVVPGADGRRRRLVETLESLQWRLLAVADEIERAHFVRPGPSYSMQDGWGA